MRFSVLINFGKNLMYVTTIGLVAILAPVFFEEKLMHPIFISREFMIQFYTPAIRNVIPQRIVCVCRECRENRVS